MTAPADFAGALQAIKDKFAAEWLTGSDPRTRIAYVNETPADPWPPKDTDGNLVPYVLAAPQGTGGTKIGSGTPGNSVYLYPGLIHLHVFVPVGSGTNDASVMAVAAGDIFKNQKFFDDVTPGCYVRSWTPRVDGGGPGDDEGIWFRVTATIPFEYWHQG